METAEANPVLKCKNMVASSRGLAESDGRKLLLFVPAAEIDHIILKFGRSEHSLIVSLSLGVILALVGIAGLVEIFLAPGGWRYELGLIVFGLVGGSLVFDAMKQRYFLEVRKTKGVCRLVFSRGATLKEVQDFCTLAAKTYHYRLTEKIQIK